MIITKLLGLTSAVTKSKKKKLAILGVEMAVIAYALYSQRRNKKKL